MNHEHENARLGNGVPENVHVGQHDDDGAGVYVDNHEQGPYVSNVLF